MSISVDSRGLRTLAEGSWTTPVYFQYLDILGSLIVNPFRNTPQVCTEIQVWRLRGPLKPAISVGIVCVFVVIVLMKDPPMAKFEPAGTGR